MNAIKKLQKEPLITLPQSQFRKNVIIYDGKHISFQLR